MVAAEGFVNQLSAWWPRGPVVPPELLCYARHALGLCADSAALQAIVGDLLCRAAERDPSAHELLTEARGCYARAIELDPGSIDAWQSLGLYLDAWAGDLPAAELAFRQAIWLGGSPESYAALARVIAEQGRREEASLWLTARHCPFSDDPLVQLRAAELEAGEWQPAC